MPLRRRDGDSRDAAFFRRNGETFLPGLCATLLVDDDDEVEGDCSALFGVLDVAVSAAVLCAACGGEFTGGAGVAFIVLDEEDAPLVTSETD